VRTLRSLHIETMNICRKSLRTLSAIGCAVTSGLASGASFDCSHAATPREHLICKDAELSELDTQLGNDYRLRRAALSSTGAELLRQSELSWLRYVEMVCAVGVHPEAANPNSAKQCLKERYRERSGQLAKVGETIGPYRFNRVDLYDAQRATESDYGSVPGFYIQHVAYPQIDNPDRPELRAWNEQQQKKVSRSEDCYSGDVDMDYEVGYANQRLISVRWSDSLYCHGTPHGMFGVTSKNDLISPVLRPILESDVFGMHTEWKSELPKLFWDALLEKGWSPPPDQADEVRKEIGQVVISADRWLFTKQGLEVSFSAYEGGCYACNPGPVTVQWSALKPLLPSNGVVP
jgi:uncharacterized protein